MRFTLRGDPDSCLRNSPLIAQQHARKCRRSETLTAGRHTFVSAPHRAVEQAASSGDKARKAVFSREISCFLLIRQRKRLSAFGDAAVLRVRE
jgi:hypothetical protein